MEVKKIQNFKDLRIWQKGIEIVEDIYRMTKNYPKDETYGLSSQMRRSAVSIPSNIAEGFARRSNKEFRHFLFVAHGSAAEVQSALYIALDQGHILESDFQALYQDAEEVSKMIAGFIKYLGGST